MQRIIFIAFIVFTSFVYIQHTTIASAIYSHDDGTAENSLSSSSSGDTNIWLNTFQVVSGGEVIESIDIAFGRGSHSNSDAPNGTPMTAYLWSDPNNDGNPLDAVLEESLAGTVQLINTNTFINFALPSSVSFDVDDWFFVGFQSIDWAVGEDTDSDSNQSWIFSNLDTNPLDPTALGAIAISGEISNVGGGSFDGNFLIRANATSSQPIPEPATVALLGIGLVGLAGAEVRRRRKKKAVDNS